MGDTRGRCFRQHVLAEKERFRVLEAYHVANGDLFDLLDSLRFRFPKLRALFSQTWIQRHTSPKSLASGVAATHSLGFRLSRSWDGFAEIAEDGSAQPLLERCETAQVKTRGETAEIRYDIRRRVLDNLKSGLDA